MSLFTKEEAWGLVIGIFIVMFVVWATLPSEHDRVISKKCYKACKEIVEQQGLELGVFEGPSFFEAIRECYDECIEETRGKNENSD